MIKKSSIFVLLAILLSSCNPYNRLARLQNNHPYLFPDKTILIKDTVIVPEIVIDTVYSLPKIGASPDTLFIENKKISIKPINDSIVRVYVKIPADTVFVEKYITVKVPVPTPIEKNNPRKIATKERLQLVLGILFFIFLISAFTRK